MLHLNIYKQQVVGRLTLQFYSLNCGTISPGLLIGSNWVQLCAALSPLTNKATDTIVEEFSIKEYKYRSIYY